MAQALLAGADVLKCIHIYWWVKSVYIFLGHSVYVYTYIYIYIYIYIYKLNERRWEMSHIDVLRRDSRKPLVLKMPDVTSTYRFLS